MRPRGKCKEGTRREPPEARAGLEFDAMDDDDEMLGSAGKTNKKKSPHVHTGRQQAG